MNLSIEEIAAACGGKLVLHSLTGEMNVSSIVLDSRKVTEGGVFIATLGQRADGHKFIPDVYQKGVSLVICQKSPEQVQAEHGFAADTWGSYLLVEDTLQALKDIAEYYRSKLTIPIVGITGSVGKTSTKEFIAGVLAEKYKVLKTEGNYNNEIGVPLTLLGIRSEHEAAVVEMGISDFGEMHRLSKMVRPNICVITNIGQCHLENLKTRDGILKAKTEIFDFMQPDGEVCLNGEDDKLCTVTRVKGKKTHFFGLGGNPAEEVYAAEIVNKGLWGSEADIHFAGGQEGCSPTEKKNLLSEAGSFRAEIPLPGIHMVTNATAAACVAGLLGLTIPQIKQGIAKVQQVGGRTHLIRMPHYTVIDDCYNANPVSMKAAIDLLAMADAGKLAILGDMFELGDNSHELHAQVGRYAALSGVDVLVCVGADSIHMYEAAKEAAHNPKILYFPDRESLLASLELELQPLLTEGCTVLVKASHGMGFAEVVERLS